MTSINFNDYFKPTKGDDDGDKRVDIEPYNEPSKKYVAWVKLYSLIKDRLFVAPIGGMVAKFYFQELGIRPMPKWRPGFFLIICKIVDIFNLIFFAVFTFLILTSIILLIVKVFSLIEVIEAILSIIK